MDVDRQHGRVSEISGTDFERFLNAKGVGNDCPACQTKEGLGIAVYDPQGSARGASPAIRMIRRLQDYPSLGYGELMQVCENCGFIRYFRDIEVLAFLEGDAHNG